MKTAVSIPDDLFKQVDAFARERKLSRSEVLATALRDFLEKEKSRRLLDRLNEVCADVETAGEASLRRRALDHYAAKVLSEDR